jgi:hypothetical protein
LRIWLGEEAVIAVALQLHRGKLGEDGEARLAAVREDVDLAKVREVVNWAAVREAVDLAAARDAVELAAARGVVAGGVGCTRIAAARRMGRDLARAGGSGSRECGTRAKRAVRDRV